MVFRCVYTQMLDCSFFQKMSRPLANEQLASMQANETDLKRDRVDNYSNLIYGQNGIYREKHKQSVLRFLKLAIQSVMQGDAINGY